MRRHIQFLRRSAVVRLSGAAPYLTILDYLRDLDKVHPFAMTERAGRFLTVSEPGQPTRRAIATGSPEVPDYVALSDGRITERFGLNATPLYLFGAGHVGRSLVMALAPLPFAVTWIDPRPGSFPSHVPGNVTCRSGNEPVRLLDQAPGGAFIAIMTHSHALDLDLDIAAAALLARRFAYVGLIGSATKRARFTSTLRQIGLGDDDIGRLICPIGLTEIHDKAPATIAAGVAAQLLIWRGAIAAAASPSERVAIASTGAAHA